MLETFFVQFVTPLSRETVEFQLPKPNSEIKVSSLAYWHQPVQLEDESVFPASSLDETPSWGGTGQGFCED